MSEAESPGDCPESPITDTSDKTESQGWMGKLLPFLLCPGPSRGPHYLEVQVVQGFQARLLSLHPLDHLWGLVVLKG